MHLRYVSYQVFEREASQSWEIESSGWHQMDGQVVLDFSDGESVFISWGNDPVQYSIERRSQSFFNVGALTSVDMTNHPYWSGMIGHEIQMAYSDEEHQVLRISDRENFVFLSSQYDDGTFEGDCVRVSKKNPL